LLIFILIALVLGFVLLKGKFFGSGSSGTPAPIPVGGDTPIPDTGVTSAEEVMSTGTMNVPASATGLVILLPNEAHEPPGSKRMAAKNGAFLPEIANIPLNCEVVWLSDDEAHTHVVDIKGMSKTKSIPVNGFSDPIAFPTAGSFEVTSSGGTTMRGAVVVSATPSSPTPTTPTPVPAPPPEEEEDEEANLAYAYAAEVGATATGTLTVGALFVPTADIAQYESTLKTNGINVESKFDFVFEAEQQEVTANTCIVYSTKDDAATTAGKLVAITKLTPYT
jgi:hypothetical protein